MKRTRKNKTQTSNSTQFSLPDEFEVWLTKFRRARPEELAKRGLRDRRDGTYYIEELMGVPIKPSDRSIHFVPTDMSRGGTFVMAIVGAAKGMNMVMASILDTEKPEIRNKMLEILAAGELRRLGLNAGNQTAAPDQHEPVPKAD